VVLIRPDGHLAWRGQPGDIGGLTRWVSAALGTGSTR
jgi:hypothetical protein